MRSMLPVIQIVGLMGCSPVTETPSTGGSTTEEPTPVPPVGNPPPQPVEPEVITAVPLDTIGELNATSSLHGRVYTLGLGKCGVDVPLPPDVMPSSGIFLNIREIDCPEGMTDPIFQSCREGILTRLDAENCSCEPVTGNPPPPARQSGCPG